MATYKAGDLSMSIETLSNDTINSLDAVIGRLNLINGGLGKMRSHRPKQSTGDNKLFGALKVGSIVVSLRRIARLGSQILQHGVDYTETLNLWQVAMKGNIDAATDFVDKMNEAYGISQKTLMNAQAIFKNMIGSLGQVSEATAYSVSEAITQMAIDYASLYNVSIDSAITKFQAALAGQTRPIRSVAGFDITENTLFQLYQTLGGTKTMRQLSRTEKQLLSIYAVFQQMQASGAVGDMAKTIDQFANQSRMASENAKELATWTGVVLQYTLQQWGVMKYINAALITASEVMKAIAISLGYEMPDFALDWADNVEDTNKAVDELQGKLLDFDKFRALSGTEEDNAFGIDTKLLEAIAGYSSNLDKVQSSARELAETWLKWWLTEDGSLTQNAESFLEVLRVIGAVLITITGATIISSISSLATALGLTNGTAVVLIASFSLLVYGIMKFISAWDNMGGIQKAIGILAILAGVITAIVAGFTFMKGNWVGAISLGAIILGAGTSVAAGLSNIAKFEDGGIPDKGTLFYAGEAGAEIVMNSPNGQTGVTNVQQIQQAMYNALVAYGRTQGDKGQAIEVYLDGERVYQNTTAHAKRRGNVWSKV